MAKIFYTVGYGCNSRHLVDVEVFDLLRDAKTFVKTLPAAWVLYRHNETNNYTPGVRKVLKQNLI